MHGKKINPLQMWVRSVNDLIKVEIEILRFSHPRLTRRIDDYNLISQWRG